VEGRRRPGPGPKAGERAAVLDDVRKTGGWSRVRCWRWGQCWPKEGGSRIHSGVAGRHIRSGIGWCSEVQRSYSKQSRFDARCWASLSLLLLFLAPGGTCLCGNWRTTIRDARCTTHAGDWICWDATGLSLAIASSTATPGCHGLRDATASGDRVPVESDEAPVLSRPPTVAPFWCWLSGVSVSDVLLWLVTEAAPCT
jgi:hypothetical protein